MVAWWTILVVGILAAGVTALATFLITKKKFEDQLRKNPPINENMIRAMYQQMGRKPTEAQIMQVMAAMRRQQKSGKAAKKK